MHRLFNSYGMSLLIAVALLSTVATYAMDTFPPASELPRSATPPDPLLMFNGTRVTTPKEWASKRRPELKELFQHYMYGRMPEPIKIKPVTDLVDSNFFGGKATLKLVTVKFVKDKAPPIHLLVVVPNQHKPAPVFVGMNFCGNHALVTDPRVPLPTTWMDGQKPAVIDGHATDAGRGTEVQTWSLEQSINRGYAVATFYYGDVEPDRVDATGGVREVLHTKAESGSQWGAVAAWAWGVQRAVDYVMTDKDLDHKRIAAVGHSRLGKATLVAAAFDDRIAIAFPHQAGCGGTAPSRGTIGESVARINEVFPHWFCDDFKAFGTQPDRLPFDQHCLIALCAPRPVLISCATEDTWSNPVGQFEMLKGADCVYRLVCGEGLSANAMPEPRKLVDSRLGYFIRPGPHSMTREDWTAFLDFADRQFGVTMRAR